MRFFYTLLVTFFVLELCTASLHAQNIDINILKELNVNRNQHLDKPMQLISNSEGYIGVGIPVAVCVTALIKKDHHVFEKGVNMSLALAANTLNTFILKRAINRNRPAVTYPYIQAFENEKHYSFPSGHTSNAFCDATSLSLNFKKWYVIIPSYAWACSVGYSRMHLGMHYPSDVLAGALLGAASAMATYKAELWLKHYYIRKFSKPANP